MRRVHAALCANGESSTLYFCSGDPDSLDSVAVPHAGLLILDGTAPHIVDPEIPGARDSIINLGECLNEPAMRPRLPHIRACHGRSRRLFAPRPRLSGRRRRAGKGKRRHTARRHGSGAPLGDDAGARSGRPLPRRAEGGRARRPPRHHRRAHAQGLEISLIGENARRA